MCRGRERLQPIRPLLMDEPFGTLDPITRAEPQQEFRNLHAAMKKTIVLVTHDVPMRGCYGYVSA